jgi:hypothetical protein
VKDDPADMGGVTFFINAEGLQKMPGDRFPFAVGVSCEDQVVRLFEGLFQNRQLFFGFGLNDILGEKVFVDVNRAVFAGEISNVPVGRQYLITFAEKFLDGFGLGR